MNLKDINSEEMVIKTFIKHESVIFDVGANVGLWSDCVLKHINSPRLYLFEPIPKLFDDLQVKYKDNYSVILTNCAMNKENSIINMYYCKNNSGLSSAFNRKCLKENNKNEYPEKISCRAVSIDYFCNSNEIDKINFVKIDTEGLELFVLQGMNEMLSKRSIGCIQFEYGGTYIDAGITLENVFNLLTGFGYFVFKISCSRGLVRIDKVTKDIEDFQYNNFLAVRYVSF